MSNKTLIFSSLLGDIHCIFDDNFLIRVSIGDNIMAGNQNCPVLSDSDKDFLSLGNELELYFAGQLKKFKQPFKFIMGTDFQKAVWLTLREIPYGETRTYKWLAGKVGRPGAFRAAGNALNKNPLPIILPCHRIILSDRSLGGFSAGHESKRLLLKLESEHI